MAQTHNKKLISHLIYIILIFDTQFLMIVPLNGLFHQLNSKFCKYAIVALVIFLCFIICPYCLYFLKKNSCWFLYSAYFFIAIVFVGIYSCYQYKENIFDVFVCTHHYLILLYTIPLIYYFKYYGKFEQFIKWCIIIAMIYCLLCIGQEVIFMVSKKIVLPGLTEEWCSIRKGRLRISSINLEIIAYIFLNAKLFSKEEEKKKKLIYVSCIIIEIFTQFFIHMTRSMEVIYLGLTCMIFITTTKKEKWVRLFIICLVTMIILMNLDISSFIESFSINNNRYGMQISTINRIEAVKYYWGIFKNNIFFGNGFIRSGRADLNYVLHGPTGTFYYSDIGILGLLAECGIIGVFIYIIPFLYVVNSAYKILKLKHKYNSTHIGIITGFVVLLSMTTINLLMTHPASIITCSIICASTWYILKVNEV